MFTDSFPFGTRLIYISTWLSASSRSQFRFVYILCGGKMRGKIQIKQFHVPQCRTGDQKWLHICHAICNGTHRRHQYTRTAYCKFEALQHIIFIVARRPVLLYENVVALAYTYTFSAWRISEQDFRQQQYNSTEIPSILYAKIRKIVYQIIYELIVYIYV